MFDILGKMLDSVVMDSKRIGSAIDHMGTPQEQPENLSSILHCWGKFFEFKDGDEKYEKTKAVEVLKSKYLTETIKNKMDETVYIPKGKAKSFKIYLEKICKDEKLNFNTVITIAPMQYMDFPFVLWYKMKFDIYDMNGNVITTHYCEKKLDIVNGI